MHPSRVPSRHLPNIRLAIDKARNRWLTPLECKPLARWWLGAITTVLSICAMAAPGSAQSFTIIYNFPGGIVGSGPDGLTIDTAGRLYGATASGGEGGGTVFRLSREGSGWVLTTLYAFRGTSDGSEPGSVVFGPDGALYGTTYEGGGACNCGVVFRLMPSPHACNTVLCPWDETVLYEFQGGSDGANPSGSLLAFDGAGSLYGTTLHGGSGVGTAYKLSPSAGGWIESLIYTFDTTNGQYPAGGVTLDEAGSLYGTTEYGGAEELGTVYELSPSGSGWTRNILYSFDGAGIPINGVIFDPSGNLYGGTLLSPGNAYELSPNGGSWSYKSLHELNGVGDYGGVSGNLLRDASGNLYGSVEAGGPRGQGSIFELSPEAEGWTYTDLHDFTGDAGGSGPSGVVRDVSGNLYGAASFGGQYDNGIIYEISPARLQGK